MQHSFPHTAPNLLLNSYSHKPGLEIVYLGGNAIAAALVSGFTRLLDSTASSSSSSNQSSSSPSKSGWPIAALHTRCHMPFFSTIAKIITTGRCHTLAQNSPLALPLCPSNFQNLTASLTNQILTGALA